MTSVPGKVRPSTGAALRPWPPALRSWRTAVGLTAVASGATMIAGAFLPWVAEFGGLIPVVGVRGSNGRMLAAAGILIVAAGLYHLLRGGSLSRWLVGIGGAVALAFSGDLLVRLSASIRSLSGGDGMVAARGGPGLWVIGAGSLLAFGTLFLPSSAQATLRRHDGSGGIVSWAADRESRGPRRWIQVGLGLAWLLDAALQYQPFMFGRGFASQIISPTSMGNPALLGDPVMSAARAIAEHPVAWNAAFATIQLALAAGLLWRPAVRAALAGRRVGARRLVARRGPGWRLYRDGQPPQRRSRCRAHLRVHRGAVLARAARSGARHLGSRRQPGRRPLGPAGLAGALGRPGLPGGAARQPGAGIGA